jgi:PAS domain S-box-containing protein
MTPGTPAPASPGLVAHDAAVLAAVFDNTNAGIFCIAENGTLSHVNPALAQLLGYSPDEIIGRYFTVIAPPDVAARADRFLRALLDQSDRISHDWNARCKDGRLVPLAATFNTIATANGQRIVVITVTDLTLQRRAEQQLRRANEDLEARVAERTAALQESEAQYRDLIEHAPVGVAVLVEGVAQLANAKLAEVIGVPLNGVVGRSLLDWTHPDDHARARAQGAARARGERVDAYELRFIRSDGETIWCEISGTLIQWRGASAHLVYLKETTEQHQLQDSLESSLAQRDTFLAGTTVGVSLWRDDIIIWYNDALSTMLGYDKQALLGKHGSVFYPDQVAYKAARREAARQIQAVGMCTFDIQGQRADGSLLWMNLNARPIDAADTSRGWIGTFVDISERKRLEARIADALAERERYLDMVTVGVGYFREARVIWHNKTLARMLGYELGELNDCETRLFYADDATFEWAHRQTVTQVEATGKCSFDVELVKKDGSRIWANLNARAIDREDWSSGRVWTFVDVSERNQLRQRLSASLRERDTFLDLAGVGVSFASGGRITWCNNTLARMLGYEVSELIGGPTSIVYADADTAHNMGVKALAEIDAKGHCLIEVEMVKKDRSRIWVELFGRPVEPENPSAGRVWTFVDLTARKEAETETLKAIAKERELVDMRSRFVAMASHEFRTPLATLLSSAEILEHYGERLPADERREVVNDIAAAVTRMQTMLGNVMNMGRNDALALAFKPAPTDLRELMRRIYNEMRTINAGEHRMELHFEDSADGLWPVDAELLRTIFTNLLGNACKYTTADGLVRLGITRDTSTTPNQLVFTVSDSGIGIPAADLPRLFDNFYRGSNVGKIAGTGIGLAMVKRAVDAHHGTVTVTSQPRKGSVFTVRVGVG